jgi:hypothetical protein
MTGGIKISWQHERELYLTLRSSNDSNLKKKYYKTYCNTLSKAAKKLQCNRIISNSNNKIKHTWGTIKSVTGRKINNADKVFKCWIIIIQLINIH